MVPRETSQFRFPLSLHFSLDFISENIKTLRKTKPTVSLETIHKVYTVELRKERSQPREQQLPESKGPFYIGGRRGGWRRKYFCCKKISRAETDTIVFWEPFPIVSVQFRQEPSSNIIPKYGKLKFLTFINEDPTPTLHFTFQGLQCSTPPPPHKNLRALILGSSQSSF